jgi:hypothetical protein
MSKAFSNARWRVLQNDEHLKKNSVKHKEIQSGSSSLAASGALTPKKWGGNDQNNFAIRLIYAMKHRNSIMSDNRFVWMCRFFDRTISGESARLSHHHQSLLSEIDD